MNRLILIAGAAVFVATAAIGQKTKPSVSRTADLRAIERLEIEWNTINEISDPDVKQRLLADDSYHVGPSGRLYTKSQDVETARVSKTQKRASNTILKFTLADKRIRLYTNVAVVTATGWSITTKDGKQRQGASFRVVHVWEKRDGRWQLAVDQVTGIAN